jgi:outer membrane protein
MMNRIVIAVNVLLLAAVAFLFFRVWKLESPVAEESPAPAHGEVKPVEEKKTEEPARAPTGKIAYVNIDRLNEESLEIVDLIAESRRRKNSIESSVESLSAEYQKKVEEFQMTQKAGIAPESDLRRKAADIERIEREAQEKQMQMDRLTMDINDKNLAFQKNVKDYLNRWNAGRYDFILSLSDAVPSMLLGNPALEVTDEVIRGLNDEYRAGREAKKKK